MNTPTLEEAMASNESAIAFIKAHAEMLVKLTADSHPGLFTWRGAFNLHMQVLSDFWNQDEPNEHPMSEKAAPKPILVLPTSTPKADVAAAVKAGYLPILTDSPDAVKVIAASNACWTGDDVLLSAMEAMELGTSAAERSRFTLALWRRIKERQGRNQDEPKGK